MTNLVEVWRYQGGGYESSDFVYGVAAAANNSVFLVGSQNDFGSSGIDLAAVKLDADGDVLWEWKEGSEGDDIFFSAAAVVDGVVGSGYVNGTWNGELSSGGADFAVVKLYSNGTVAWRWKEGTDDDDFLYAAIETVDGNVVVAGYTLGTWNDTVNYWNDIAVAKLNVNDGEVIWRYQGGTTEDGGAYGRTATARGDGSVVVGGYTFGSFAKAFEGDDGATDFIAVALDEDGNELWRWQDGPGTGFNYIFGVAAFDDDSVLLAGLTEGSWAIDNEGERDFALSKLNASGHLEWIWQEGTEYVEEFSSAAIGNDGSAILSGYTYGSWATTQAGTVSDRDFVAMSINTDGNVLWRYQAGSTSDDDFNDVAVRPDGSIILGGWTFGIWTTPEISDSESDFAALLLNYTTSINFLTPSPTPSSTPSPTPSPIPSQAVFPPSPSPVESPPPTAILTETKSSPESDSGTQVGIIIGTSVGCVAVVAILIACWFCCWRRDKRPKAVPSPAPQASVVVAGRPKNTERANGDAKPPLPAYTNPPPTYADPPPAYSDPPPAYSSVA